MAVAAAPARPPAELKRQIGLYAATAITVGNIIGSGIFRSPHSVAQHISSFPLAILAWVIGGVLSICGSLALAELAVTHPKTGGLYVFIREGFGDAFGFVFGWSNLWVIKPTVIASITTVFALYFCQVLRLPDSAEFPVGAGAILLLTFINWLGVKQGAGTQSLFTTAKVLGILALCAAAFALPTTHAATTMGAAPVAETHSFLQALALAMISILFAYDGWTDSTYVAGEVIQPKRTLPIAIVWGTWLVIGVYVLTNLAYFHVLGAEGVARYEAVGSETIRRLLGSGGRARWRCWSRSRPSAPSTARSSPVRASLKRWRRTGCCGGRSPGSTPRAARRRSRSGSRRCSRACGCGARAASRTSRAGS